MNARHPKDSHPQFDVVVVGAGMIGMVSTCLFARQGLRVGLVEAQSIDPLAMSDGRVSAINLSTCNLLKALGVWRNIDIAQVSPYHTMKVWDNDSLAKISFLAHEFNYSSLGYIIENHVITAAMLTKLRQSDNVTTLDNTQITKIARHDPDYLMLTLSDQIIKTRLLVGADGGRSRVRELSNLSIRRFDFQQDAITATLSVAYAHGATTLQCFLKTGPVALLPLADGRCSLVWSCDHELVDELMQLSDVEFRDRLKPLFAHEVGEIIEIGARRRFTLIQQHAEQYIADSVALIGDAAHIPHPLAGLGANIGFSDAAMLAEVVECAHEKSPNIGRRNVLRRYERRRKGDNALTLAVIKGLKEGFGSQRETVRWARTIGMNLVDKTPSLKAQLVRFAAGQHGNIPMLCRNNQI